MIAAIYARKSTEQNGVADESKSVARQIAHARAYALRKHWVVADDHVYVDDGISGAEFANRPGFVRLMGALKPRPAFNVLIMSEESRLGREAIETAYALKQVITAHVRVFYYLEDIERTFESPTDKLLLSVAAFADELERDKARQRTYDALSRKARAGHVVGGRVFGYRNVDVCASDGTRSHVEHRIIEAEASIVRRIYQMYGAGDGLSTIAQRLNADGVPSPRAQQGRVRGWCPSSIRAILGRSIYRGERQWNRTRKRDSWGQRRWSTRPESEWVRIVAPELRVVSPDLATAVDARRASMHERARRLNNGRMVGRPPGEGSPYLLTGLLACGVCGGGMEVLSTTSQGRRVFHYRCQVARRKGAACCTNTLPAPMGEADRAVLAAFEDALLNPAVVEHALADAEAALRRDGAGDAIGALERELRVVEAATRHLTKAIAAGGELVSLVEALGTHERRRQELLARLTVSRTPKPVESPAAIRRTLSGYLGDWQGLLRANVQQGQQILRRLIVGRLTFTPKQAGYYTFEGKGTLRPLLEGAVHNLASPTGFEPVF